MIVKLCGLINEDSSIANNYCITKRYILEGFTLRKSNFVHFTHLTHILNDFKGDRKFFYRFLKNITDKRIVTKRNINIHKKVSYICQSKIVVN